LQSAIVNRITTQARRRNWRASRPVDGILRIFRIQEHAAADRPIGACLRYFAAVETGHRYLCRVEREISWHFSGEMRNAWTILWIGNNPEIFYIYLSLKWHTLVRIRTSKISKTLAFSPQYLFLITIFLLFNNNLIKFELHQSLCWEILPQENMILKKYFEEYYHD